ncbi:MAG: LysR family transcriptional regulator [Ectothiorhodospiraceae bacterium]|nr:LysR family transcriptional regulator [Ectothiorhodospiraceae bacterium]
MDRLQAMTAFVRVVEQGSFARAADRLGMSVSSVSRLVAELERHLDARLLNRTTRRLSLTETGQDFHQRCVQLLSDLEEAEEAAGAGSARPRGTLRVSAPITFGTRHLAAAVAEFVDIHPGLRLELDLSDRGVDLVDEGFDLAVRIGPVGAGSLVARRIGTTRMVCCAAPRYLARRGTPRTPADLAEHDCLTYEYSADRDLWRFRGADSAVHDVRVEGPVHANNGRFLEALAVAGLGITFEPDFIVGPDVRAGRLVPLLTEFEAPASGIHVVYPSRRHLSAKVRAFTEFLATRFQVPEWALER